MHTHSFVITCIFSFVYQAVKRLGGGKSTSASDRWRKKKQSNGMESREVDTVILSFICIIILQAWVHAALHIFISIAVYT